jgi:integrase
MGTNLLRDYFERSYRRVIEREMTYGRVNIYARAVELVDRFAGGRLRLNQVDEQLLSRFVMADGLGAHSDKHRRELAGCVRQIIRAWNPNALDVARARPEHQGPLVAGSLRKYFEEIYLPRVTFGATPGYAERIRDAINVLHEHYGRDILLKELSDSLAADHFRWLLANGRRRATVNTHRAHLFVVWRHAHEAGDVAAGPRVKKLSAEHEEPDAWSLEEFSRILAAALRFQPGRTRAGVLRSLAWHALLLVAWYTGLRRRALVSLRRSDVDRSSGWIYSQAAASKTKRGKKFRVGPDALEAIEKIWLPERELLFPSPVKDWQLREFGFILADAGIPAGRGLCKFHKIRRTAATHLAARVGVAAASRLLQHSSEDLTRKCYIAPQFVPDCDCDATQHLPTIAELPRKPR